MSVCFQLLKLRFRSFFLGGGGLVLHHLFFFAFTGDPEADKGEELGHGRGDGPGTSGGQTSAVD